MNLLAKHGRLAQVGPEGLRATPVVGSEPTGNRGLASGPSPSADLVGRLQAAWDRSRAVPPDPQLSLLGGEQ